MTRDRRILVWGVRDGWAARCRCPHGWTDAARYPGMHDAPALCTPEATIADVMAAHNRECGCCCAFGARVKRLDLARRVGVAAEASASAPAGSPPGGAGGADG